MVVVVDQMVLETTEMVAKNVVIDVDHPHHRLQEKEGSIKSIKGVEAGLMMTKRGKDIMMINTITKGGDH